MISDAKTKKTTKKAKTDNSAPQAEQSKDLDLNKGQYLLFNNDKGDNPKRPDLRGQVCLPDGTVANISAWKRWTITNEMKLEGSIQTLDGNEPQTIGRMKLYSTSAKATDSALMVGEAEFESQKPMAVTLYGQTSKDGMQYFSGFFNEIAQERVDPLADTEAQKLAGSTYEAEQDEMSL